MRRLGFALMSAFAGAACLTAVGCVNLGEGTLQPTKLYLLNSISTGERTPRPEAGRALSIGVGPVHLPEYLDRPQIVRRLTLNELAYAEFAQWAEPLRDSVSRVLQENLSILLETDRVSPYPASGAGPMDYQVSVEVTRLDTEADGTARLVARWTVSSLATKTPLIIRTSAIAVPLSGAGVEAAVAAQSRALESLSREIAAAIRAAPS
jgi:uncharacterized lipoprotein YmbA